MILLTGSSGFIGKLLLSKLILKFGEENILIVTSKDIYNKSVDLKIGFFNINVELKSKIKIIIHLGAFTPKSKKEANNINGSTQNIYFTNNLTNMEFSNLEKIIYVSTLDVYLNNEIIDENTDISPQTLYAHSKLFCEKIVEITAIKKKINYIILRLGHVYGPGEYEYEKIIPVIFKNLINKHQIELYGSGDEIRSFIYIEDIVNAIINSMEIKSNQIINIVSEESISIKNLINLIFEITESQVPIKYGMNTNSQSYKFDNTKFKKYLLPKLTSLKEGLKKEFIYFQNYENIS